MNGFNFTSKTHCDDHFKTDSKRLLVSEEKGKKAKCRKSAVGEIIIHHPPSFPIVINFLSTDIWTIIEAKKCERNDNRKWRRNK